MQMLMVCHYQVDCQITDSKVLYCYPLIRVKLIHALYNEAAQQNSFRAVSLSEFKKIWLQQCPHIVILKPATDLCAKCQKYVHGISNNGNLSEEDKEKLLENYRTHLSKVKCQRDYYREKCEAAKLNYSVMTTEQKLRGQPPCSLPEHSNTHLTLPSSYFIHTMHNKLDLCISKLPGSASALECAQKEQFLAYFTPGTQVFYLIGEAECTGKCANCVTSLLHHHFQHHGFGEEHVQLQMDNCSGQNKNNTVLWYGLWRTMTGLHKTVEFSLMEAGHTKFSPDWHFGVFKSKWRHCTVETLDQIATCVLLSSKHRHNIPQLVNDSDRPVLFYDWSVYLGQFFKCIPSLKKYHHFSMTSERPGVVLVKEYAGENGQKINVFKKNPPVPSASQFPSVIVPKGLDPSRQWYLFNEIRQYCLKEKGSCPKPLVPKPETITVKSDSEKRKKCSYKQ